MRKISTLFTVLAIASPAILTAQGAKKVATQAQIEARASYRDLQRQQMQLENTNLMTARPTVQHHQTLSPNGKTAAVAPIPLGTSSNGFTALRTYQNQVTAVDSLDMVAFIHRQDINIWGGGSTENGKYRYDVSIDGGATFNNDQGPLQTVFTNYGRYPQIAAYNPGNTVNPFDARMVWYGPTNRFPTPGWIDHVNGLSDVTITGTTTSTEHYNFDNRNPLLPGGLCQGLPGEFWGSALQDDGTGNDITDTVFLFKGTYDPSGNGDVNWIIKEALVPGYDMTGDGSRVGIGPNVAFSPDGMHGWIGMISNIGTDPKNTTLFPVFWHSTDGGATWGSPIEVDIDQFPWVYDSLRSLWVDTTMNPASSGAATTAFEFDMIVDNNGDVHMGVVVGTTGEGQAFSISSGLAKFYTDIFSTGGGTGWNAAYIAPVLTFRGEFGTGSQTLTQDNYPQISRNNTGSWIFYSWVDSDTAQFTGNQTGVGFSVSDNVAPNLRIAARRVLDGAMPYPKLISDGDLVWEGKMLIPTMAPTVMKNGNRWELPIVAMEMVNNDVGLACAFHYFGKDAWFDFTEDEICNPATMQLGWNSWGYTGGLDTCGVNGVGINNPLEGMTLHQSFPNPATNGAVIRFVLPVAADVTMDLVNVYGQTVATLASGNYGTGIHDVNVDTDKLAAGVYFYSLRAEGKTITKKMIITK